MLLYYSLMCEVYYALWEGLLRAIDVLFMGFKKSHLLLGEKNSTQLSIWFHLWMHNFSYHSGKKRKENIFPILSYKLFQVILLHKEVKDTFSEQGCWKGRQDCE